MKLLNLFIVISIILTHTSCSNNTDVAGGIEIGNGKIIGQILALDSAFAMNQIVYMVPAGFNPQTDHLTDSLIDTCNHLGEFSFSLKEGTYTFTSTNLSDSSSLFIQNLTLSNGNTIDTIFTMLKNGTLKIISNSNNFTRYYIPETNFIHPITRTNDTLICSQIPAGNINSFHLTNNNTDTIVASNIIIPPFSTTIISADQTMTKISNVLNDNRFNNATASIANKEGTIFIGTADGGLYSLSTDGIWSNFEFLQSTIINKMVIDNNGVLWLGTGMGLYYFSNGKFYAQRDFSGEFWSGKVIDLSVTTHNEILVVFNEFIGHGTIDNFKKIKLAVNNYTSVNQISSTDILIGTSDSGIIKLSKTDTTYYNLSNSELKTNSINFIESVNETIWIGTSNLLYTMTPMTKPIIHNESKGFHSGHGLTKGFISPNGTLWFVDGLNKVASISNNIYNSYLSTSLIGKALNIESISTDKNNNTIICFYGGGIIILN